MVPHERRRRTKDLEEGDYVERGEFGFEYCPRKYPRPHEETCYLQITTMVFKARDVVL